jgi:branched-chain amino acid aminotransferase
MSKENYVNYNGNLFLRSEINLGINRAMRFGDGVFETIRVINGELIWWKEHFDRLLNGLKYLYLDVPELFIDELLVDCLATLHRNDLSEGGILRVFVYRKGSGGYTPTSYDFDYVIETEHLIQNQFKLNKKGLNIGISKTVQLNSNEDPDIKTLNKIPYIRAAAEKVKNGWDEILILNEKNKLVEASSSNLFLVKKGQVYTPSLNNGVLNGISRQQIINQCKSESLSILERELIENDLLESDEVFISNSISGIKWVGSFKMKRYFNRISQKLIMNLKGRP